MKFIYDNLPHLMSANDYLLCKDNMRIRIRITASLAENQASLFVLIASLAAHAC